LRFDRRGGVEVRLQTTVPPAAPEIWRQALETALHAPLDQVREEIFPGGALWMLQAHADAVLESSALAVEGTVDLKPLLDLLGTANVKQLSLYIEHPSAGFSECPAEQSLRDFAKTRYFWDVPVASPPPIRLAFGYPPERAWRLWVPIAFPLAAVGLSWWLTRRRRGEDGDWCVAWFRAWKIQRRLIFALWFSWAVLVLAIGFVPPAGFLLSGMFPGRYVWMALALLLPPALAVLVCKVMSAPAFAGVPEVGWTHRRLFLQALWGQLGIVAVGVCVARGMDAGEADPSSNARLLNFLGAVGLALLCLVGWLVVRNAGFPLLPPGETRQRLFELAEQIQVRVHQAHLVPAVPWRLLNALGTLGNCVYLTGEVLPHLSRREVDALLALELVRLWQPRGRIPWRTLVSLPLMLAACAACGILVATIGIQTAWPLFLLPGVIVLARGSRRARHFVPARDRNALAITGDPEALITALAKLHRLQLLPLVAGEERKVFAGPLEDWPRLQDLADRANIPPERLQEILDRPGSGEDRYPHEPAAAGSTPEPEDRVFSKVFKQRAFARQNALRMVVEIGIPALTAYFGQSQGWHGVRLAGAYLAGLLLLFLTRRRLERFMSGRTAVALRRGLRDKMKPEGFEPDAWKATLVGLAPHG
jgi:hypothetical protein